MDQRNQAVVVEPLVRWLENHDRAHMHGCRRLLHVEEGRVKGGQPVGHNLIVSDHASDPMSVPPYVSAAVHQCRRTSVPPYISAAVHQCRRTSVPPYVSAGGESSRRRGTAPR